MRPPISAPHRQETIFQMMVTKRPHVDSDSDCDDYDEDDSNLPPGVRDRKRRRGVIEKKRRDRINNSLAELKRLVPQAFEKQGSTKLEKAEILQLTVDYLKEIHPDPESDGPLPPKFDFKQMGFRDCVAEVGRYLLACEGMDASDPLRLRLMSHLQCFFVQGPPQAGTPWMPTGPNGISFSNGGMPPVMQPQQQRHPSMPTMRMDFPPMHQRPDFSSHHPDVKNEPTCDAFEPNSHGIPSSLHSPDSITSLGAPILTPQSQPPTPDHHTDHSPRHAMQQQMHPAAMLDRNMNFSHPHSAFYPTSSSMTAQLLSPSLPPPVPTSNPYQNFQRPLFPPSLPNLSPPAFQPGGIAPGLGYDMPAPGHRVPNFSPKQDSPDMSWQRSPMQQKVSSHGGYPDRSNLFLPNSQINFNSL